MLYSTGELSAANQLILPMECTWNYTSEPNIITRLPSKRKAGESEREDVRMGVEVRGREDASLLTLKMEEEVQKEGIWAGFRIWSFVFQVQKMCQVGVFGLP